MTTQTILYFKDAIYNCAKDFRLKANYLMSELASAYSFKIEPSISFGKEAYRHYNNKGLLNGEWIFYFHGSHCHFEHIVTGQVVEVLFTHSPEFGYIIPYFFHVYVNTTKKHRWLEEILSERNAGYVMEVLVNEGMLTSIKDSIHRDLILAI